MVRATEPKSLIGASLDHFVIEAELGRGGMGVVYVAEDRRLDRRVALKVLREDVAEDPNRRARFLREARTAAAITHPNLAAIYAVGEAGGAAYLAMELVEGRPLRAMLEGAPLAPDVTMRLARGVAAALAKAHDKGIVHRDLKPENVLVTHEGDAKVVDFGLAKVTVDASSPEADAATEVQLSSAGAVVGTPAYMSPEQARGQPVDHRSDVFSFGVMLYEMATGERPFRGATHADLLSALLRDEPASPRAKNPDVSASLERVILRCLAKDAGERYASAHELARDLEGKGAEEAPAKKAAALPSPDRKSELILLERVREFWIDGVLRQGLRDAAAIELAKDERMGAVDRGLDMSAGRLDEDAMPIDPSVTIGSYFDRRGRALLILGEPGAGKTFTMLELAKELVARAFEDERAPLVAVFSLATWRDPKQGLEAWLVDQLCDAYRIPSRVGGAWIAADRVTLLLDGLDEVAPSRVAACVRAVNAFRDAHGFATLAVACRRGDYEGLPERLKLDAAIVLRALSEAQIEAYLKAGGDRLAPLREALAGDAELRELAGSPLMLNIMSLSYASGADSRDGAQRASKPAEKDRRTALFDRYVDRMFRRREGRLPFDRARTSRCLSWLARAMQAESETVLQLENLQPSWLEAGPWRTAYFLATRLPIGAVFATFLSAPKLPVVFFFAYALALGTPLALLDLRMARRAHPGSLSRLAKVANFVLLLGVMSALVGGVLALQSWLEFERTGVSDLVFCFAAAFFVSAPPATLLASRRGRLAAGRDVRTVESLRFKWRAFALWGALLGVAPAIALWVPYRNDPPLAVSTWSTRDGAPLRTWERNVTTIAFSDAKHLLATDAATREVKALDITTGAERETPMRGDVVVDPGGRFFATIMRGGEGVRVYDATTMREAHVIQGANKHAFEDVTFIKGELLFTRGEDASTIYDAATGAVRARFEGRGAAALDGEHVLLRRSNGLWIGALDGTEQGPLDIPSIAIDARLRNIATDPAGRWVFEAQGDCLLRYGLAAPHERTVIPTPVCPDLAHVGDPTIHAQVSIGLGAASLTSQIRATFGVAPHTGAIVEAARGHLYFFDADGAPTGDAEAAADELFVGDEHTVAVSPSGLRFFRTRDGARLGEGPIRQSRAPWNARDVELSQDDETVAVSTYGASPLGVALSILLLGLFIALGISLEAGVVRLKTRVNEGIHRTARRAALVGLSIALLVFLANTMGQTMFGQQSSAARDNVLSALFLGLLFAIGFGGLDLLQHYALRALLAARGALPLRATLLLDSAVQLIFLRKVGGGYIFVHRLLLEHFAGKKPEP